MLLTGTQIMPAPRNDNDEESALLRCRIAELNRNTVRLITQTEELVEESKQLLERIKSFENRSSKSKRPSPTRY